MWRWNQQRGRKRFPLSHKKRKNEGERDCEGNESLLQLGRKLLQLVGGGHEERKRRERVQERERKSCDNSPEAQERRRGEGIFRTALMRKMNDERCNKR